MPYFFCSTFILSFVSRSPLYLATIMSSSIEKVLRYSLHPFARRGEVMPFPIMTSAVLKQAE